jgi:UDP-N-acetylmuramoyl-tripeptide--D-alanyl-D-alanine ligase
VTLGGLFFAIRGAKVDGHDFLEEVARRGGVAAVVSRGYGGADFGLVLIRVEDVGEALRALARGRAQELGVPIVGITGSMGKTTVKEFAATLLGGRYRVGKPPLSYNSKLTMPLTLLNASGEEEIHLLEMGMSAPGELRCLLEIASPQVGVITKVGLVHAAAFPDGLEGVIREKCEMARCGSVQRVVVDHALMPYLVDVTKEKIGVSLEDRSADYFISLEGGRLFFDERGVRAYVCNAPFTEPHILHNLAIAVATARTMGMDWSEIDRQMGQLKLPKRRFESIMHRGIRLIDDAYNANPDSMRAALSCLPAPAPGGKRIAVLGSMKELGPLSEAMHQEVGIYARDRVDWLLTLGDEALQLCEAFAGGSKPAEHFSSREALAERLCALVKAGDVVLFKGSRSMELERVLESLRANSREAL